MFPSRCLDRSCFHLKIVLLAGWFALCISLFAEHGPRPAGQLVSWGRTIVPLISPDARFVSVAAGDAHTVAVNPDGTVTGWGDNSVRQLAIPVGLSNVISVAAGGGDTLALRADGTLVGWGINSGRLNAVFAGATGVKAISMGNLRAIALRDDGTVLEWAGSSPGVNAVPKPENLSNVVAVAAGGRHSLALLPDGNVIGWGYNFTSQAIAPPNATNVVAIDAGDTYSMALRSDGTVIGWGTIDFVVSNIVQMAAGPDEAAVVQSDGSMTQIKLSGRRTSVVQNISSVKQIAAGEGFHGVLYQNGELRGFGENRRLQASIPKDFSDVVQLASFGDTRGGGIGTPGNEHFVALRANGTVFGWDNFSVGRIDVPPGLESITSVAVGELFSLALRKDGTVTGWGNPQNNQLAIPADLTNAIAIAANGGHSLALRTDRTVSAWGYNAYGQTTVSADLSNVVAVAAGLSHSMALSVDGSVACWGLNINKQCNVPHGLSDVIAIAAGGNHSLALRVDGTVVAWGDNTYRQTSVPVQLTGVVGIAGGTGHSVAYLDDGSIVVWGSTNFTALPSGTTNQNILSLASAFNQTAAVIQPQPRIVGDLKPDGFDLSFWGFRGRRYILEHSLEQPSSLWAETISGGIEGKWGWMSVTATKVASTANRFYRLRVEAPDTFLDGNR